VSLAIAPCTDIDFLLGQLQLQTTDDRVKAWHRLGETHIKWRKGRSISFCRLAAGLDRAYRLCSLTHKRMRHDQAEGTTESR